MILNRLEFICAEEKVQFHNGVLKALIKTSEGDLRRAITSLQSCYRLKGKDHVLAVKDVHEISGVSIDILQSAEIYGISFGCCNVLFFYLLPGHR